MSKKLHTWQLFQVSNDRTIGYTLNFDTYQTGLYVESENIQPARGDLQ